VTPEQEKTLNKTFGLVTRVDERLEAIEVRCVECHVELARTRTILDGEPGNGQNPGLRSRVALVEQSSEKLEAAYRSQLKWMRAQLAAIITAAIAVFSKWFVKG
jgi:hypothetical protein